MPRFKLVPKDGHNLTLEFKAPNAAECLNIANRHAIGEGDLYQDDAYLFTIRQGSRGGGCWVIQTQPERFGARPLARPATEGG